MLFAPRGLWGLFADRTGLQLFPVRRILAGQPKPKDIRGSD
jgi:branched-chain amino acid transport system permease protein